MIPLLADKTKNNTAVKILLGPIDCEGPIGVLGLSIRHLENTHFLKIRRCYLEQLVRFL